MVTVAEPALREPVPVVARETLASHHRAPEAVSQH